MKNLLDPDCSGGSKSRLRLDKSDGRSRSPCDSPVGPAHCTLHTAHCILHTAHCTLQARNITLHTTHITLHTRLELYSSHVQGLDSCTAPGQCGVSQAGTGRTGGGEGHFEPIKLLIIFLILFQNFLVKYVLVNY